MLPIDDIAIQQYRGLRELALRGCRRINLVVGAMNSGKTSLLEAIELLCDPLDPARWIAVASARDVRGGAGDLIGDLWWLFPKSRGVALAESAVIGLRASGQIAVAEVDARAELGPMAADPDRIAWGRSLRATVSTRHPSRRDSVMRMLCDDARFTSELAPEVVPPTIVVRVAPQDHRDRTLVCERLSRIRRTGLKSVVLGVLRALEPEVIDLDVPAPVDGSADVWIRHKGLGIAPLRAFGDGLRQALLIALTVPHARGGVLLIDEVAAEIPGQMLGEVFAELVRMCVQFDVQLFASTRRRETLDGLLGLTDQEVAEVVGFSLPRPAFSGDVKRLDGSQLRRMARERRFDIW